jgi:hypothetical protein
MNKNDRIVVCATTPEGHQYTKSIELTEEEAEVGKSAEVNVINGPIPILLNVPGQRLCFGTRF